jgi:hypothetical protein
MRPMIALEGVTDEIKFADTKEELVEFYQEQRVAPYYEDSHGRKIMRHHDADGPLADYLPINIEHVDGDGAGILEDNTRKPLDEAELAQLIETVRSHGSTHPTIVHRLLATISNGGPVSSKSAA